MNLYEILLPAQDNTGKSTLTARELWLQRALDSVGGFTDRGLVTGTWKDAATGILYPNEPMHAYHVACEDYRWLDLVARAHELFPDQQAIFTAKIGEATIYTKPKGDW